MPIPFFGFVAPCLRRDGHKSGLKEATCLLAVVILQAFCSSKSNIHAAVHPEDLSGDIRCATQKYGCCCDIFRSSGSLHGNGCL